MLGLGLSITLGGVVALSAAAKLAKAFKARVEADGGTVESMACLTTDLTYLTNNPNAPAGYSVDFSSATVGSSADFIISGANIIGYSYTYAVTDSQATEVTGTGVIDSNADTITADLSTLVDGTVTVAVYLSGAGGDGLVVTDTATLVGFTGLLNDYSGAAAAYSLRLLDNTYSGNAVRVRRASDNTEQNIGFANNELDTTSLETFCSGTDGFVTTWYDQSGNAANAAQATASLQPKIVASGSTILDNGKAAASFAGDSLISVGVSNYSQPNTYFIIANSSVNNSDYSDSISGSNRNLNDYSDANHRMFAGSSFRSSFAYSGLRFLRYSLYNGSSSEISINGASVQIGNPNNQGMNSSFEIGDSTSYMNLQEFILYNSNESTNRTGIETNINDHYSIY